MACKCRVINVPGQRIQGCVVCPECIQKGNSILALKLFMAETLRTELNDIKSRVKQVADTTTDDTDREIANLIQSAIKDPDIN